MSGHSKWASIKHKKATTDAKRGKLFSKIVKEICIAARLGGSDPDGNPRLRSAVDKAKGVNMPQDNIKRAILKGTGELAGVSYEETQYEGYGPGGVALLVDVLTDNKNRTVGEIRHMMGKHGGNMADAGSVSWIFEKRGYILVDKTATDEDTLMGVVLDAGATDMKNEPEEESFEVLTEPEEMEAVRQAIESAGIAVGLAEITKLPKNYVDVDKRTAEKLEAFIDALEDHDDVQNVYVNLNITDGGDA